MAAYPRVVTRMLLLFVLMLFCSGCAQRLTTIPDSAEAMANWQTARNFQAQGRYELARQYYVVALAASRSPETQTVLKRELDATERMIQALR